MKKRDKIRKFIDDNDMEIRVTALAVCVTYLAIVAIKQENKLRGMAQGTLTLIEMNGGETAFNEQLAKMKF